jgi:hypothetical protein
MKYYDEIRFLPDNPEQLTCSNIYDYGQAIKLFNRDKRKHKMISIMKHNNIRVAIKDALRGFTILEEIKTVFREQCGYCFKYKRNCNICTIKRNCRSNISPHNTVSFCYTIDEFSSWHKIYCMIHGIWQKEWE